MSNEECIALLGGWKGYQVGTMGRLEAGGARSRPEVWIELKPVPGAPMRCSGCFRTTSSVHDFSERWVRDLPLFDASTWLLVQRRRVRCALCGPKLEFLSWLSPYSRVTRRLGESVARLCRVLSIRHAADYFGLCWDTVKAIDKAHLTETWALST